MTLKHQKDIRLINNCDAIYDEDLLKKAILWYSATPVQQSKKIFLYGNYAAVSIGRDKIQRYEDFIHDNPEFLKGGEQ